jgi:hypothetical protein
VIVATSMTFNQRLDMVQTDLTGSVTHVIKYIKLI